jgi:prolyl oligopeptidase
MTDHPTAPRLDLVDDLHGHRVADPYRWLEDDGDPRTVAWLAAQDSRYERARDAWPNLAGTGARLAELAECDGMSLPRLRGDHTFFALRTIGRDHPALCVSHDGGDPIELVDPMRVDPSGGTTLEIWHPSVEGDLLAYQLAGGGTEESRLRVLDVATGEIVDGPIDRVRRAPVAWLPGGRAYYYVRRLAPELVPPAERRYHRRVYLHRVGTSPDDDVLIFGDGRNKTDYYGVTTTPDGRWLTISVTEGTGRRTDLWLADLSDGDPAHPELRPIPGVRTRTIPYLRAGTGPHDPIVVLTDGADGYGRLAVTTPADLLAGTPGRVLVPATPPAVITDFTVLDGHEPPLVVVVRARHAVSELTVHNMIDGSQVGTVPLPGPGSVAHVVDRPEGGHEAWFTYTDPTTPPTIYRYDARTGRTEPFRALARPAIPTIATHQVDYPSADGTPIRMTIMAPTGRPDRPRPTILMGYGGFGLPMVADYQPMAAAWVGAGGVYAIAHVRGGGEEGEDWHRAAIGADKHRTFDDFAAAADHLVDRGWTTTRLLGLYGGSNGGLLIGAALTRFPEKFTAAVCAAPLLDMVRYERSGLGPSWRTEYGTADDPEQLEWLLSYSPYHHVHPGTAYPATLFTVFDGDIRVDPWHARKFCAALQHATTGDGPILLRTERGVGHSLRAMSRGIGVVGETLAFLGTELGLPVGGAPAGSGSDELVAASRGST